MKKLFTNDKFFLANVLIAAIGLVINFVICRFIYPPEWSTGFILFIIVAVCLLVVYFSYKKHNKNVMKGMIGAVLMAYLIEGILGLNVNYTPFDRICTRLMFALSVCLFISHFVINGSRKASPVSVLINQLLCFTNAITSIVWNAIGNNGTLELVASVLSAIAWSCVMFSIVCVESRLDAYRLDREAAGWTEEKGYPEGYVHEYEKNVKK